MRAGAQTYKRMAVESAVMGASPEQLVKLMLDAAIQRLEAAARHAEANDIEARARMASSAVEIIGGLQESLDLKRGKELAKRLAQLYDYMQRRVFRAGLDNDPGGFIEVAGLLGELRHGWQTLAERSLAGGEGGAP